MKFTFFIFVVIAIAVAIAVFAKMSKGNAKKGTFGPRTLITANEQGMFWKLISTFPTPEFIVLTQVSFGALLTAKNGASRYSFSQKRADFVLTNKGFKVLAIIELDDSSHKGRENEDSNRDAMLIEAGYKVLRYTQTPDATKLLSDVHDKI